MERYSEYKDSGVQWLGEIPGHWELRKFKYLFSERSEKNHPNEPMLSATQTEGVILQSKYKGRVVVVNTGFEGLKLVKVGDFVIHLRSFQGGIEYTYDRGIISSAYTILNPNYPEYSYYYKFLFKSKAFIDLLKICVIGIREGQNINYSKLKQNPIPLPPLAEQKAIAAYLDTKCGKIDQLLEGKQKQIGLLAEIKQRIIADAVTRGLNPSAKMKTTDIPWLPEVPAHWGVKRLSCMFTGEAESNKDFEYQHAFKFNYGRLIPKNETGDPEEYREVYIKYTKVKTGDILINGLNLNYDFISQRVACAPSEGIITSAYIVCRPRECANFDYYTYLFKGMDSMKLFHGMGTGIRLTLSFKELKKQNLPVPPISEQREIVAYLDKKIAQIDTLTAKLQQEIATIKEYKQRLISDVVTGQIKVCG